MSQQSLPLVGVFLNRSDADTTIEEFRRSGVPESQVRTFSKPEERGGVFRLFGGRKGDTEGMERELKELGYGSDELSFYRHEYDAGHTLIMVYPGDYQAQARTTLIGNGAYTYAQYRQLHESPPVNAGARTSDSGSVTPGMRPDDSSQSGVATTAKGVPATEPDQAAVDSDLHHLHNVTQEHQQQQQNP